MQATFHKSPCNLYLSEETSFSFYEDDNEVKKFIDFLREKHSAMAGLVESIIECRRRSLPDPDLNQRFQGEYNERVMHDVGSAFSQFLLDRINQIKKVKKESSEYLSENSKELWVESLKELMCFSEAAILERQKESPVSFREFYDARNEFRKMLVDVDVIAKEDQKNDLRLDLMRFEDAFWFPKSYVTRFTGRLMLLWYAIQDCWKLKTGDAVLHVWYAIQDCWKLKTSDAVLSEVPAKDLDPQLPASTQLNSGIQPPLNTDHLKNNL